jgi:MFS family permease
MLAFANLAASADKAVVAVYAPELRTAFHLSDAQIGSLQGGPFVIGYILTLLWAGRRTAAAVTARYVAACIAVWTVGAALFALAPGFPEMLAGRLVLAIGQAAFAPAAILLLNNEAREAAQAGAARFLSLFTASSTIGRSVGLMLGGALIGAAAVLAAWLPDIAAWRISGLAMLIPNLLLLALFLRSRGTAAAATPSSGLIEALRHVGGPARPALVWMVAGCGMIVVVQACAAWAPSILHRQFDVAAGSAGIVIGVVTLIAAPLGHLGAGWILSRWAAAVRRAGLLLAAAALSSAGFRGGRGGFDDRRPDDRGPGGVDGRERFRRGPGVDPHPAPVSPRSATQRQQPVHGRRDHRGLGRRPRRHRPDQRPGLARRRPVTAGSRRGRGRGGIGCGPDGVVNGVRPPFRPRKGSLTSPA